MRKHWPALTAFALLIVAYTVLNAVLPPDAESLTRYNLTSAAARALRLTLVIPLIIIWTLTMYGYLRFKNYAQSIVQGQDGPALSHIADGILALALWLPLSSILTNAATYVSHRYPQLTQESVIVRNYIGIGLLLLAVYLLWRGSERLLSATRIELTQHQNDKIHLLVLFLSTVFAYLTLFNPSKNTPPASHTVALYYLPDWLLILTIIIPYTLIWFYGIRAVANVRIYARQVRGVIYRSALGYLANGLAFSIGSLLLLRYLGSFTAWLSSLALKPLLIVLYLLIFVVGISSVLLAIGARKLQKIEEV
jgi:hypothetical protein